jgi:hypothetical protein
MACNRYCYTSVQRLRSLFGMRNTAAARSSAVVAAQVLDESQSRLPTATLCIIHANESGNSNTCSLQQQAAADVVHSVRCVTATTTNITQTVEQLGVGLSLGSLYYDVY